jgi:hypothetical protein
MFSDKSLSSDPKLIDFGLSNKFDTKHLKLNYQITYSIKDVLRHLLEHHYTYHPKSLQVNMMKSVICGA